MIQYLLGLGPAALLIAIVITLVLILTVLYILARIFFCAETAEGIVGGAFWGIFIGVVIGLICQYISAGSIGKMLFSSVSWMPFVFGWAVTVLISSIIGGIRGK
ncbi:MAG: hypothetical protein K2F69_05075 [Bacteroidaceae bacterium]|nr:hypothetical protein [Bacteroidaceae bacterium]